MHSNWLRKNTRQTKPKQNRKKRENATTQKPVLSPLYHAVKAQYPAIVVIIFCEFLMRYASGSDRVVVVLLLGAVIYTALKSGLKQGIIAAGLTVVYSYHLVIMSSDNAWFSIETLQRGAVIAVVFPILAYIIGRLKERNDALLGREQTARQKAEMSERQLRFMAESMPQKIFTTKPDGTSDYANPQWQEYTGEVPYQEVSNAWPNFIHPDDLHENTELWQHSLKTGEPFQFEHRLRRNDGQYIWHLTRAHALRDEHGAITTWVGSTTDIEDVRKTRKLETDTARLIKQRAQLMELNNTKDEFISLASHQLRTPATSVKQYINMALDGYAGEVSPRLRTFLEKANNSNERQLSVISDLLRVAQIDAGKVVLHKEKIDLGELIENVIQEYITKFSACNQTLTFAKPKRKIKITADAIKLRMAVENIIDNASKYTPKGKNVTVQIRRSQAMARIIIKDEGVGIEQKDITKIFQKFLRLDNPMSTEVGGNGLGLYWVQKVIELHDGNISVTSKINSGSTFTISLPLSYTAAPLLTK